MEKYKVESSDHSIVMPGKLDVGLERDGRFVRVVRVAFNGAEPRIGDDIIVHTTRSGEPVAYEYKADLFLQTPPQNAMEAWHQFNRIAGAFHGSLDKLRFYMALRAAMQRYGMHPTVSVVENMLRFANWQAAIKER